MHAIGFWHEHSRPDRNKHVKIIAENIATKARHNFYIININQANMVGEYDICSIMHYPARAFRKKDKRRISDKTIVSLRKRCNKCHGDDCYNCYNCYMGQRKTWTYMDVQKINLYYNCKGIEGTLFNWHGRQETPVAVRSNTVEVSRASSTVWIWIRKD